MKLIYYSATATVYLSHEPLNMVATILYDDGTTIVKDLPGVTANIIDVLFVDVVRIVDESFRSTIITLEDMTIVTYDHLPIDTSECISFLLDSRKIEVPSVTENVPKKRSHRRRGNSQRFVKLLETACHPERNRGGDEGNNAE
jgi:hypothetical protein